MIRSGPHYFMYKTDGIYYCNIHLQQIPFKISNPLSDKKIPQKIFQTEGKPNSSDYLTGWSIFIWWPLLTQHQKWTILRRRQWTCFTIENMTRFSITGPCDLVYDIEIMLSAISNPEHIGTYSWLYCYLQCDHV